MSFLRSTSFQVPCQNFEGVRLILHCRCMAMALPLPLAKCHDCQKRKQQVSLPMGLLGPSWINRQPLFFWQGGSEICFIFTVQRGGCKMVIQSWKIPPIVFCDVLYEAHAPISPADPWTFVQRLQATVEAFFDTQYEQHLRPASQTRHGEFPFIGGKSRLVTVGEVLYPSAPVITCEVRCLGTQTKPIPKPLAEGRA